MSSLYSTALILPQMNEKIASDYVIYDAKCIPMQMYTNIISDISKIEIMQKDTCLFCIKKTQMKSQKVPVNSR